MKRLIFAILVFAATIATGQTPIRFISVDNDLDVFEGPLSVPTFIYDIAAGELYAVELPINSGESISTSMAELSQPDPAETDPVFLAWDKDYNELINTPTIPSGNQIIDWTLSGQGTIDPSNYTDNNTQLSDGEIAALGYIKSYTETDPVFLAWDKDYNELINTPTIPSGNQIIDWTLSGQGTIDPSNYTDNNTQLSDGEIAALGYIKSYTETDPVFLAWDKDYNDLINRPAIPSGNQIIDWTLSGQGTIDPSNYTDNNTQLSDGEIAALGYIKSYTETDPAFLAWDKDYNDLINTPDLSVYWKSDGTSTATDNWDMSPYRISASGVSTSWGVTTSQNVGAFNAIMGTSGSATWLLSGTSGGVFKGGIQLLDWGGITRFYTGSNFFSFDESQGSLTANGFVKSGGTSSQFLKADGSVDGSTYLTSYTETDPIYSSWDKDYDDLTNKPTLYEGETLNTPSTSTSYTEQWSEGNTINLPQLTGNTTLNIQNIREAKTSQIRVIQNASSSYTLTLNLYSDSGSTQLTKISFGANTDIDSTTGNVTKIVYQRIGSSVDVSYQYQN